MLDYLTLNPPSFGLDFSDRSIKIVFLKKKRNSIIISSWNEIEIDSGIIELGVIKNEKALINFIIKAISESKGNKLKTKHVIASLPEERSFLQIIQIPKMTENEIRSTINYQIENYIPLSVNEVYIDFEILGPTENNSESLNVLINAIPKEIIDPYVTCLKESNLQPKALEIESQAIVRSLIKNGYTKEPTLIVDIGKNRTSLAIFFKNSLQFTFSFSFSSEQITEKIKSVSKVTSEKAEEIKKDEGLSNEIIKDFIEILLKEIKKHTDFYETHSSNKKPISKIILCGGGSELKGIHDYIQNALKINTEIGNPLINLGFIPEEIKNKALRFTTAIGLALRNFQ